MRAVTFLIPFRAGFAPPRHRFGRHVHRHHSPGLARDLQGEAAVVGEGLEHAAAPCPRCHALFSRWSRKRPVFWPRHRSATRRTPSSSLPPPSLGPRRARAPPAGRGPPASAPGDRLCSRIPSGDSSSTSRGHDLRLERAPWPGRGSGSRGRRRSGRPRARAGRRPRRAPAGTPRLRGRSPPASARPPARRSCSRSRRGRVSPRCTMRSRISDWSDQKAKPRTLPRAPVHHAHHGAPAPPARGALVTSGAEHPRVAQRMRVSPSRGATVAVPSACMWAAYRDWIIMSRATVELPIPGALTSVWRTSSAPIPRSPAPSGTRPGGRDPLELIASENFVSQAVLEAARHRPHQQVRRGLPRQALLRRLRVRRRRRERSPSTAPSSSSAPSTSTSSRTPARRPTWPSTSRC